MNGTHAMLSHFPIGFWALATLMILVGSFMTGRLADISRAALLPVLVLSLLGALAAIAIGFIVWPMAANLASPLARNHILMAFWSLGIYSAITVLVWKAGDTAFDGARRWVLVILALTGSLMFASAGTLGGHLTGSTTAFSQVLSLMGWEVYTTFYSPLWVIAVMVLIGIALGVLGIMSQRRIG
ncbi:heme ABC transporter permease [Vreelandella andesensis]|uniref:Heme ABC transporter permease n=1 Tax=Vreelandella andesensis TaxID=447567 RepID=A0A433KL75_9GAMM|nr:heme ABC transporter permease [Halomonas andesensis]RUR30416.1 heme ABC transporter permease [Halomonas andesensis]